MKLDSETETSSEKCFDSELEPSLEKCFDSEQRSTGEASLPLKKRVKYSGKVYKVIKKKHTDNPTK